MPGMSQFDIAVIGAGGAGQMALLRAVLNHLNTIVFTGDATAKRKSRAQWVVDVENIPGMFGKKRPITATTKEVFEFIENNDDLSRFQTRVNDFVTDISKTEEGFVLKAGEETYQAKYVVLCTGTMDIQPEIKGTIKTILPFANKGDVEYCIRCDGHKTVGQNCAVIGEGASSGWIAIMLKERYDLPNAWVLTHGKPFEGDETLKKTLTAYGVDIVEGEIEDVKGSPKEGMDGFIVNGKLIPATKAFVALGSIVYNDLAKQLGVELDNRDHVLTSDKGETNVSGFFAAGDLVSGKKKQVYTAWDDAVDCVDAVDARVRKEKREKLLGLE